MEVFSKYSSLKSIHFSIYFIIIFEFMYLHIIIEGETQYPTRFNINTRFKMELYVSSTNRTPLVLSSRLLIVFSREFRHLVLWAIGTGQALYQLQRLPRVDVSDNLRLRSSSINSPDLILFHTMISG